MSKAFTRESEDSGPEEVRSFRSQLPSGTRNYITREGAERLKERLNELHEQKLAMPGHSDQRKLESAIRSLQVILSSVILADVPVDKAKVAFGATVNVRHANGEQEAYHIVGVEEADPERGAISWISPLARALMARREGDTVSFQSPAGAEELTILKVTYSIPPGAP
jgi:transcription elongation factor GreB